MVALVVRRLLLLPFIILSVYVLTFSLAWLVPVNPLQNPEGRRPPPEIEAAMRSQYRLDDPAAFFMDYLGKASGISWLLGRHARPFDLGPSLRHPDWTVNEILAAGLPVSITLGLVAMVLALLLGTTAGVVGGLRPGSGVDMATLLVALVGISLPSFVAGATLLVGFAVLLPVFPVGGWGDGRHLVLPAITLSLPFAAYIARLTRMGMVEQMRSDYVRTALAKGLSRRQAAVRHALRNALLPVVSYLGPATAAAMTGSFVVEKVFAVPGIGRHFVDAVLSKDLTLIMGVVLVYSTMLVLLNLVVDVAYRWVDPRIS